MTFVLKNRILMAYDQRPADPQRGRGGTRGLIKEGSIDSILSEYDSMLAWFNDAIHRRAASSPNSSLRCSA
jgi:hypothetical protein